VRLAILGGRTIQRRQTSLLGSDQLQVLRKYRWSLTAFTALTVVAAVTVSAAQEKTYKATAQVRLISSQQLSDAALPDAVALDRFTETYAELARSSSVINEAARRTEPDISPAILKDSISVSSERSGVVSVEASAPTARRAASYANHMVDAFVRGVGEAGEADRRSTVSRISGRIRALRSQLNEAKPRSGEARGIVTELQQLSSRLADSQARPADQARVIERARVPTSPSSPKPVRSGLLALGLALIVGSGLAYLHFSLTNRFRSAGEASKDLDLPVLGVLPKANPDAQDARNASSVLRVNTEFAVLRRIKQHTGTSTTKGPISGSSADESTDQQDLSAASAGRSLTVVLPRERAQTQTGGAGRHQGRTLSPEPGVPAGTTVLVTSSEENTGKTYVTASLARAFAAAGKRVVAVDGDLVRPTLHHHYHIPLEPGFADFLAGTSDFVAGARANGVVTTPVWKSEDFTRRGGELDALAAGQRQQDASEMLSTGRMAELVARLRQSYEVAVFDSPPAGSLADAAVLARHVDGVILVIDSQRTSRRAAKRAVQALRWLEAPLLGIVFNRVPRGESYHAYGYGYDAEAIAGRGTLRHSPVAPHASTSELTPET
jgi:protein-tyrosine kinase